jgi:hypothetical protein
MIIDEAERLLQEIKELPDGLEAIRKFVKLADRYCPESIGLEDTYVVFDCDDANCFDCWLQALKEFIGDDD